MPTPTLRSPDLEALTPYTAAGFDLIPLNRWDFRDGKGRDRGKSPRDERWRSAEYALADVLAWAQRGGNVGVRLRGVDLVIDWDPRNAPEGRDVLLELELEFGLDLATCPQVATGSGGRHFYLILPEGCRVLNALEAFPGVEFKSLGRQVVAAGAIHPNGTPYTWAAGPPLADRPTAPALLVEAIRRPERTAAPAGAPAQIPFERAAACLRALTVEAYREHDAWLELMMAFHAATGGSAEGLEAFVTWSIADAEYADDGDVIRQRWESLSPDRGVTVGTLFHHVLKARGAIPPDPAADDFADELAGEDAPRYSPKFERNNQGKPKNTVDNALKGLLALELEPAFDEFHDRVELRGDMSELRREFPNLRPTWGDETAHAVKATFLHRWGLEVSLDKVHEAARIEGLRHRFHPVLEYLDALRWDGKPRLDRWLFHYVGVPESEYSRAVGRLMLLGAVGRAYRPAIKFDSTVIFEGIQGAGKSELLKRLVPDEEWVLEGLSGRLDRDTVAAFQGKWLVEIAELAAMRAADLAHLKHFLTARSDTQRLAYRRDAESYGRRCIFIGTTNESVYLRDDTGNRRFLPVRVGRIDLEGLEAVRDQLWAEARAVWTANPTRHALVLPRHLWSVAADEQEQRRALDPWEVAISQWLDQKTSADVAEGVSTTTILHDACRRDPSQLNRNDYIRLAGIMRRLGWYEAKVQPQDCPKRVRGWRRAGAGVDEEA